MPDRIFLYEATGAKALLRYRMRGGDVALATHLKQGPNNGKYLSSRIQNEILDIALKLVRKKVLLRIQKAECWTLIIDETLDVQRREQLVIAVRYLSQEDGTLRQVEDPVTITDVVADIVAAGTKTRQDI